MHARVHPRTRARAPTHARTHTGRRWPCAACSVRCAVCSGARRRECARAHTFHARGAATPPQRRRKPTATPPGPPQRTAATARGGSRCVLTWRWVVGTGSLARPPTWAAYPPRG
eukprot:181779-Prymnesium_polylepis.2